MAVDVVAGFSAAGQAEHSSLDRKQRIIAYKSKYYRANVYIHIKEVN